MFFRNKSAKSVRRKPFGSVREEYWKKYRIRLKSKDAVTGITKAGELVVRTLDLVAEHIRAGVTTESINTLVHEYTLEHGAVPAPLNYQGFPKSVCVSINNEICHGIPGPRELREGDIVNVDVTSILDGWFADANRTFLVGEVDPEARRLVDVTRRCLALGIGAARPGATLGDIGHAIQLHAEGSGYSVVRDLVGHGVGHAFHEQPQVSHVGRPGTGIVLVPGMVFTIEPMINQGGMATSRLDDGWTVVTADGSLSAQFEQTILITETGSRSLTPFPL
ncbi:MAG: type I methionyl aminopeptidase [Deltaproteobacteria bacterium]|nr:type I methionyl aminopeptidase [Deltaproteobacteria bacterium]